jgi:hypothetical protein
MRARHLPDFRDYACYRNAICRHHHLEFALSHLVQQAQAPVLEHTRGSGERLTSIALPGSERDLIPTELVEELTWSIVQLPLAADLAVDGLGRVYVATLSQDGRRSALRVYDPGGRLLNDTPLPTRPAAIAIADSMVYVLTSGMGQDPQAIEVYRVSDPGG